MQTRTSTFRESHPIKQLRVQPHSSVWTPRSESLRAQHVRSALALLFGPAESRPFNVRLWNGASEGPRFPRTSSFTLVLRRPESLARVLLPPSGSRQADAYLRNDVDVEGDLEAAVRTRDLVEAGRTSLATVARLAFHLVASATKCCFGRPRLRVERGRCPAGRDHELVRNAGDFRLHREVGSDFYALWLDRQMALSAGHFPTGKESLHDAQQERLDQVCRSLRVREGDRLLDLDCGWGALLVYAAERYDVEAVGVTTSEAQADFVRRRIAEAGLAHRVRVVLHGQGALPDLGTFDRIASVGTFEHAGGVGVLPGLRHVLGLLRPGGTFLGHRMVALDGAGTRGALRHLLGHLWPSGTFLGHHGFGEGRIPRLAELVRASESLGFESGHAEGLTGHFMLTLRHWLRRLEQHHARAVGSVGEASYRMWRLYLAALAHSFASGRLGVVQVRFEKSSTGRAQHRGTFPAIASTTSHDVSPVSCARAPDRRATAPCGIADHPRHDRSGAAR